MVSVLAGGWLNKQIAYELDVKDAAIKARSTGIFRKPGIHLRTEAVLAVGKLSVEVPAGLADLPP